MSKSTGVFLMFYLQLACPGTNVDNVKSATTFLKSLIYSLLFRQFIKIKCNRFFMERCITCVLHESHSSYIVLTNLSQADVRLKMYFRL